MACNLFMPFVVGLNYAFKVNIGVANGLSSQQAIDVQFCSARHLVVERYLGAAMLSFEDSIGHLML
jgi:hypothetical protein